MNQLFSYSMVGKVIHDDVPDVLALAVDYVLKFGANKAVIVKRPF